MKSIREIYKIGTGPSSSHTMGPERAALQFMKEYPDAHRYQVILYGSLNKTGVGHGTDSVLRDTLGVDKTEIIFSPEYKEKIAFEITKKYLKEFPNLEKGFNIHFCNTADGVEL